MLKEERKTKREGKKECKNWGRVKGRVHRKGAKEEMERGVEI